MMAVQPGITANFSHLCDLFISNCKQSNLRQPVIDRKKTKSRLKKKLYDTLFEFFKRREGQSQPEHNVGDEIKTQIWWHILRLRQKRKFDEANKLEHLFNSLLSVDNDGLDQDDLYAVLNFMLKLQDNSQAFVKSVNIDWDRRLPVLPDRDQMGVLPEGPLCFGDTQMVQPNTCHYMHYPRSIFESEPLCIVESPIHICNKLPGIGLAGNGYFSVVGFLADNHEKTTSESLFGGLVQGRVDSLDVKLELPELPEDMDSHLLETRIPKSFSTLSMDLSDEGFKSREESVTSTTPDVSDISLDSAFQADYDTGIYEDCLNQELSQYYTWETIGLGPGPRMKPFLTEAGPEAFDHWIRHMLTTLNMAFPSMCIAPRAKVSQSSLVKEVLNVMIAVPSTNFILDLTDQCFTMREGVYISGVSTEALHELLEDFLVCGMHYYRLNLFSTTPILNSFYHAGLTFRAFTDAIQLTLQYYRAAILSAPPTQSLIQLRMFCHKLMEEIRFLARLCKCDSQVTDETKDSFPTGIHLLSYVYRETLEASFTDHYPLMLSILRNTCTPYLLFVQNWVYHGVFHDNYGEFMIEVNDDYLQFRDKHYWTHGYTLTASGVGESVPEFLRNMAKDIFVCGKSINLLKTCSKDHFLCDVDDQDVPRVCLTFSVRELQMSMDQCAVYSNRMQQISQQHALSRQETKERKEKAKQDLITMARVTAAQELGQLQDKMRDLKKAADAKKRKELLFLKNQMEEDLRRRASLGEEAAREDKAYMDRLTRKEETRTEEELELERQAREELIEYYSQLSEEAARREQKALWKVRRAKLDMARAQFLKDEENRWASFMERAKTDPDSVCDNDPIQVLPVDSEQDMPGWVKKSWEGVTLDMTGEQEVIVASDLEGNLEKNLPKWAQKGLQKYGISVNKSPSPRKLPLSPVQQAAGRCTSVCRSLDSSFTVNQETEELPQRPSVHTFEHIHATTESTSEVPDKPHIKINTAYHATKESESEAQTRVHVKSVGDRHITQQSKGEEKPRPHLKSFSDKNANIQSSEPDFDRILKLKPGVAHASKESEPTEWKIKNASQYGHVSELSKEPQISLPKLKKSDHMSATVESYFSAEFLIKPGIKVNKSRMANSETTETFQSIPHMKMNEKMSATKESEYVDYDKLRLQMFRERNIYGHAADSTVQRLLYQGRFGQSQADNQETSGPVRRVVPSNEDLVWLDGGVEPYKDNFDFLNNPPVVNLLSTLQTGHQSMDQGDSDGYRYLPLPAVIQASITSPLEAQVLLVNENLVNYYIADLQIVEHFQALRRYLCMGDGDFSEILCDLLMEKLSTNPRPQDLVNPMFLNNCLSKAVRLSINADDKYADNLSFIHKYLPKTMEHTSPDLLDCIQLDYEVKWPLNIVVTKNSLFKYSLVFSFMLQLKRVVWTLKEVWQRLKRDAAVHCADRAHQFRQLHLYRQEMQHFIKVMQGYISHQVVEVTWQEFQIALANDVHNLDDLHDAHSRYLDKAIFRCLLTKNASSLMKIIQDIFRLILKFHRQLALGNWQRNKAGVLSHRNYTQMCHTYKVFLEHTSFLFKVVRKLAVRGYEPHLHDLLLRLNFNNYYDK